MVDCGSILFDIKFCDLRIPFHFGEIPVLAFRIILDGLLPLRPDGEFVFHDIVLDALQSMVSCCCSDITVLGSIL